jgi:hypothetical protein
MDLKEKLLNQKQEDEKDKNMKVGIKYLRKLGFSRRNGCDCSPKREETRVGDDIAIE